MSDISPEAQLDECLAAFEPEHAALATSALKRIRKLLPGSIELVYDAYNALSIGFATGEKLGDCYLHLAIYPRNINLGFNRGTELDDPDGLLEGTGRLIRHVPVRKAADLDRAPVVKLVKAAAKHGGYSKGQGGRVVIKKIYANKRARRPDPVVKTPRRRAPR